MTLGFNRDLAFTDLDPGFQGGHERVNAGKGDSGTDEHGSTDNDRILSILTQY